MEQAFVPREVFFRSGDRFHHLRISVRAQQVGAVAAVAVVAWGLYATTSYVVHRVSIAAKDQEIAEHKLAYFDLLTEVGEYHTQFSRITRDLEENQAYLLSLLEQTPADRTDLAAIQGQLKSSETEQARVTLAREGLRAKMEQFQSDLLEIAGKNITLQSRIAQMRDLLVSSNAERDEVAAARAQLVKNLSEVESDLARVSADKQKLEGALAALQRERDGAVASLRQELGSSQGARQELLDERSRLNERIAGLERELREAHAEQAELGDRIAGLDTSLAEAVDRGKELRDQRDVLQRRADGLEQHLVDLRDAEQGVIERLSERTKLSVDVIEKTVAMTGLDVDTLIAQIDHADLGRGGPFVPASEEFAEFQASAELGSTVNQLDEQLDRWSALRTLVGTLPLTAPLDQYRISSGYGERRDPVNGRKARHRGVDFAAPSRSPVYATAPGTVVFAGWRGRYGRTIEIDHGHGIRTRYSHLRKILVKAGQEVDHRRKIGLVGSSGRSTGPHVHYEVRFRGQARNPMKFLKAGKYVFKG
ncbi:MAG: peptidoglycan DD-metalloendopeptidase family protein [Proteobacteria bacterium]|nr:peptidoglycan DD-metalloendopeptidase family protein [Pseudomonadota bacterium]